MSSSRHLRPLLTTATGSSSLLRRSKPGIVAKWLSSRGISSQEPVPLRKHLKDEAKRQKAGRKPSAAKPNVNGLPELEKRWELTVGIEIHAELNTARKLFSPANADSAGEGSVPNSAVAPFDAALPGAQPQFQVATLLPALRAALALNCDIQRTSAWDRKHYFHWDQPNGYQITQYYSPFATAGHITLTAEDGIPPADLDGAEALTVEIKQVQIEQDTGKTASHGAATHHVDLNRAGHPLIEIITLPQIHSPQTAAAVVRKVQMLLRSVDACTRGMEFGGMRADVNVSVRRRGIEGPGLSYGGVSGLGQRTEIKNLSSTLAVEKAVVAERDRQIQVLEAGGVVDGETRGWTLGASGTTRLRGKEGEVDYRYMPDPDLHPLIIGEDIIRHLRDSLPESPDATAQRIKQQYDLTLKDAMTLATIDDGEMLDFLEETVHLLRQKLQDDSSLATLGKRTGDWVLHEIGGLRRTAEPDNMPMTPGELSDLLENQIRKRITRPSAKRILAMFCEIAPGDERPSVEELMDRENLRLRPMSDEKYQALVRQIMEDNPEMVAAVREKGQKGKRMWFVGELFRRAEDGTVEPEKAMEVIERLLRTSSPGSR